MISKVQRYQVNINMTFILHRVRYFILLREDIILEKILIVLNTYTLDKRFLKSR